MIKRTIAQLAEMIKVENDVSKFQNELINGVCIDTRKISSGNLFVPFKGENTDGHQHVEAALNNGAGAVLWQKDVPNPPENAPVLIVENTLLALQQLARSYRNELSAKVIGITGSNGKTTTKDIAAAVFSETFKVHKTEGNFNNHIGLPLTILGMEETTEIAILEMGMSGKGEISLLTRIARPDVAIITNIGEAHLLDLGSREAIAEAKLEIAEGLPKKGVLIYPGNEPLLIKKISGLKQFRTCTFGESAENDLYPEHISMSENGSTFTVSNLTKEPFNLPISGKHNVLNALSVLLAAKEFSLTAASMQAGLKAVKLSNMRMEWHHGKKGTSILNDAYNASPTAMRAVISMVENMDGNRDKIVVLGDMLELGDQEKFFHEQIGTELDPGKIKFVFTYGHLGKYIAEGAKKHFPEQRVFNFTDKAELVSTLIEKIEGNEIVLFKASRGIKLEEAVEALISKG
ncbi:UDP-N-acetylmuramoyl-tripeptide--D-alanyl-D-alanine ligase [Lederbergia citrea]|uniref:UDP-N-acetylmuramoyl-tripeptide--D-alanyl-D-alanine ligase n=1 Tax=Lederbergia citrea TaxID=2833581 RepID=A0A942USQ4_9BACI|nr:UDP-N-acetylmuramoyl-tripeptide--D-alanyl-D-alanine ligase [Lederbergia citrea]MBS4205307.1 UDP-N-acetylmuramoyl-tripeptide--D-alanyl-D-alanine ligase [Lederbergia citrea]MBS4224381.1 UDP-N-acetylmuramoyl-tripeptide--D-alanyl-D-alanine ligase [Lederbergia citrea]